MSYPASTPSYAGFNANDTLATDNHAAQHNQEQADIVQLADKVGLVASTPVANTVLRGTGAGNSAWQQVNLSSDVTGVLPVQNGGTGVNSLSNLQQLLGTYIYPVGCIYTETSGVNPGTTFGFGTWAAYGQGRVLIGNGTSDESFSAGSSGGESNHTLQITEIPSHTHTASVTDPGHDHLASGSNSNMYNTSVGQGTGASHNFVTLTSSDVNQNAVIGTNTTGVTVSNSSTGGGGAHNNLQPYIVVYFWIRNS